MAAADFAITNHGSIFTIRPLTATAQIWWNHHIDPDALQFGGAYAVEPRYVEPIVNGMLEEGLTLQ